MIANISLPNACSVNGALKTVMNQRDCDRLLNARTLLKDSQRQLDQAQDVMRDLLLSLDTVYATQDGAWQEGEAGQSNCRQSDLLRFALEQVQQIQLPRLEGMNLPVIAPSLEGAG